MSVINNCFLNQKKTRGLLSGKYVWSDGPYVPNAETIPSIKHKFVKTTSLDPSAATVSKIFQELHNCI
ncbi:MAG: hypothetical protein Nk1A_8850 [Endomicrobiia bacterium]|nr:MAG: hypothetical protein Nk1A_8850 [Endomicrobiia bacterium]